MANPYLLALGDEAFSGPNEGMLDHAFLPLSRYLENARKALEKKEVSCEWQKLPPPDVTLSFKQKVFEVKPYSLIEFDALDEGWFEILEDLDEGCPLESDFEACLDEPATIGKGKNRQHVEFSDGDFREDDGRFYIRLGNIESSSISWMGYSLAVQAQSQKLPDSMTLAQQQSTYQATRENGRQYRLSGLPNCNRPLLFDENPLTFHYVSESKSPDNTIEIDAQYYIVSQKQPKVASAEVVNVTQEFLTQVSVADLRQQDLSPLPDDWILTRSDHQLTINTGDQAAPKRLRHAELPALEIECKTDHKDTKWIQLVSTDHGDENGVSQDPLEYFFDDQVDILDGNNNDRSSWNAGYRILKARPDERQMQICKKKDGKRRPVYPEGRQLKVRVNTLALKRQRDAINSLKFTPATEQKPLLDLLKEREQQEWPGFAPYNEQDIDWSILKNLDFDGCDKQREFVSKALATPDFAILDGPPGTGKTTTILELIIQLVRQGKRILLTASTHAAINNVLERIDSNNLINEVFPLRIGDENRAIGVEHYQYDRVKNDFCQAIDADEIDQFMVESSNLVCGTTMGILRLFNNKSLSLDGDAALFDVMIIDECSKTTFAEFLVPARYAKRWVLVGDVKQLSPFTDREQITANLQQLVLQHRNKHQSEIVLSPSVQRACLLLSELRSKHNNVWGYHDKLVVPVSGPELDELSKEISARSTNFRERFDDVLLVGRGRLGGFAQCLSEKQLLESPWHLYSYNLIFCKQNVLDKHLNAMPADAVVLSKCWRTSAHHFRHLARYDGQHQVSLKGKDRISHSFAINSRWLEHDSKTSWADELVWRLEREYWLRFLTVPTRRRQPGSSQSKASGIQRQLEQLLPKSVNADGRVYGIRNMAFPSILEALSGSGILKQKKDSSNTLNQGFYDAEKACRHTTLTYQHRMHPDISKYPRNQFYSSGQNNLSLLDGSQTHPDRTWSYSRYDAHAVWLDVEGKTHGNANEREARAIVRELKCFADWAPKGSDDSSGYSVAVLTFYKKQENLLRAELQKLTGQESYARFSYRNIDIKLNTVDFFQGQEADLVFLSMVNTKRDGFLDSPNRLNVAVTRARFQLVVAGSNNYFARESRSDELRALARALPVIKE